MFFVVYTLLYIYIDKLNHRYVFVFYFVCFFVGFYLSGLVFFGGYASLLSFGFVQFCCRWFLVVLYCFLFFVLVGFVCCVGFLVSLFFFVLFSLVIYSP